MIRKHIFFAVLAALLMIYLSGQVFIGWFSSLLQRASTTMAVWLFALSGVPVQREGFVLHTVNSVSVFVSKDCGGIRSTLAMLILAVVATYLYLRTPWRQAAFIVSCLSWNWRGRSSVKIAERTHEKRAKALHRGREGGHPQAALVG